MNDGLEYLGRARMQGVTLLVLAFLVGVLAGVAGDQLLGRPHRPPVDGGPGPGPRSGPPGMREGPRLPRVLEEMDLSESQRGAIDSILASGRPRNDAIMRDVLPRLQAVSDSLRQAIRAVLTPAQAAQFDRYVQEHPARGFGGPTDRLGPGGPEGGPPDRGPRGFRPPLPPPDGGPPGRRGPPPPPGEER